jgi:hypothetical protein
LLTGADLRGEIGPVDPLDVSDLGRVRVQRTIRDRRVHRADLVLQHPVHLCLVAEAGQNQAQVIEFYAELLPDPAAHPVRHRLGRRRMAAAAVRPHAGEDPLGLGPPGQQEQPGRVEHVAGERQVQRRPIVVDGYFVRYAPLVPSFIKKHNALHEGARYQDGRTVRAFLSRCGPAVRLRRCG